MARLSRESIHLVKWQNMVNAKKAQRQAVIPIVSERYPVLFILLYTELLSSSTLYDWYFIWSNACFEKC